MHVKYYNALYLWEVDEQQIYTSLHGHLIITI